MRVDGGCVANMDSDYKDYASFTSASCQSPSFGERPRIQEVPIFAQPGSKYRT
jgi:hypothetical protein